MEMAITPTWRDTKRVFVNILKNETLETQQNKRRRPFDHASTGSCAFLTASRGHDIASQHRTCGTLAVQSFF